MRYYVFMTGVDDIQIEADSFLLGNSISDVAGLSFQRADGSTCAVFAPGEWAAVVVADSLAKDYDA